MPSKRDSHSSARAFFNSGGGCVSIDAAHTSARASGRPLGSLTHASRLLTHAHTHAHAHAHAYKHTRTHALDGRAHAQVAERNLTTYNFLAIDIEGSELMALQGAPSSLPRHH